MGKEHVRMQALHKSGYQFLCVSAETHARSPHAPISQTQPLLVRAGSHSPSRAPSPRAPRAPVAYKLGLTGSYGASGGEPRVRWGRRAWALSLPQQAGRGGRRVYGRRVAPLPRSFCEAAV